MKEADSWQRYSRQMLFPPIGEAGQRKLAGSTVLIAGMGALGTVLASHMVRSGVGRVRMVDRDYVELSNLQRQILFDEEDARELRPKVVAAARKLARINPEVELEPFVADIGPSQVESWVSGVDLVLDGTDNFQTRLLLNDACYKQGVPLVYGGAVSSQGMTAMFVPGETSCLRCLIGSGDGAGQTCDTVGVISPIVDIVASFQAVEAMKWLVGAYRARRATLLSLELWEHQLMDMRLPPPREGCPTCQTGEYPSLHEKDRREMTLCGRGSVQIVGPAALDLASWEQRLSRVAQVKRNEHLLRATLSEEERLILFADGRVLIQGTEDFARARTLYDRYIGS